MATLLRHGIEIQRVSRQGTIYSIRYKLYATGKGRLLVLRRKFGGGWKRSIVPDIVLRDIGRHFNPNNTEYHGIRVLNTMDLAFVSYYVLWL